MEKKREDLFIDELETQLDFALFSIDNINKFLIKMDQGVIEESENFWYYSQNLIVYSGNISKILWGVYNKKEKEKSEMRVIERKELREKLRVSESSILKKRYLRNALEHIDEKLEDFTEIPQTVLNKIIAPKKGMFNFNNKDYDISKEKNLRYYDPEEKTFYFYGQKSNLQDLFKGIKELKVSIEKYKEVAKYDFYR